jgi:hypothetical protein
MELKKIPEKTTWQKLLIWYRSLDPLQRKLVNIPLLVMIYIINPIDLPGPLDDLFVTLLGIIFETNFATLAQRSKRITHMLSALVKILRSR